MRQVMGAVLTALALLAFVPAGIAGPAETAEEWERIVEESLLTHNYDACGTYAQKLARFRDQQGRYQEAVAAFENEFFCWGQFPDRGEWVLWDQRRAEQIRPEVRAFVTRTAAGEHPGRLAKHEPAFGTMLGATIDLDPTISNDLSKVARAYGKPYAMVLVYARWNEPLPVVPTRSAKNAGAALQVAWEPSDGLDAVQDGPTVRNFAKSLREYGLPVFLRFGAEMNGAWTPWYGDPAKYREKFALIARIMREAAPNVAMVWSPNFVGDAPADDYYPGDESVDWVGINLYHEAYFLGKPGSRQMLDDIYYQGKRSNPLDKVKAIYASYARRKPIMLSETGFGWATRDPYQVETTWASEALQRFYGYLPLLYPRIKAISYFNVDFKANPGVPSSSHYVLSGNPLMVDAYRQAAATGWYLGDHKATSPQFWRPMELATLKGQTRVAAYVNLGDAGVSRVEYLLDGQMVAAATALPWEADMDLAGLSETHAITVRAYDRQGRLGAERTYSFDASAIQVDLNGRYLDFDQPPINEEGRILVPARVILEALGAEITWEPETRTVVARRDGSTLRLQIDNPVPTRDGLPLPELSVPARIVGNRTLVPARFVAENFGMDVKWDQTTRTVIIRPL